MNTSAQAVEELLKKAQQSGGKRKPPETRDIAEAIKSFEQWSVAVWVADWSRRNAWSNKKSRALAALNMAAAIGFEEGLLMLLSIPEVSAAALDSGVFWFQASEAEALRLRQPEGKPLWLPKSEKGNCQAMKAASQRPALASPGPENVAGSSKYTALGFACINGQYGAAKILIENERLRAGARHAGAALRGSMVFVLHGDSNAKTRTDISGAVAHALLKKEYDVARVLGMGGAGSEGLVLEMEISAKIGDLHAAALLMQLGVNFGFGYLKNTREELLAKAIAQKRIDIAQRICSLGADPSEPFEASSPLENALERGYLDGIFFLAPATHFGSKRDFERASRLAKKFHGKYDNGCNLGEWIANAMARANPQWAKDEKAGPSADFSGAAETIEQEQGRKTDGDVFAAVEGFKSVILGMSEEIAALKKQVERLTMAQRGAEGASGEPPSAISGAAAKTRSARETLARAGFEQLGKANARRVRGG